MPVTPAEKRRHVARAASEGREYVRLRLDQPPVTPAGGNPFTPDSMSAVSGHGFRCEGNSRPLWRAKYRLRDGCQVRPPRAHCARYDACVPGSGGSSSSRRGVSQSVLRAFDVLATLREAGVPLSALQAARATGLDRTVVHRLLRTLVAVGVAVEDGGRFALGPETVRLGNAFLDTLPARRVALPYLVEVQTGTIRERPWTVTLSVAIGDVTTVVERIWNPAAPLTTVLEVGDTFAADLGAAGRSMLAFLSADEVERVLGADRYAAVADTLEEVRAADGVALTRGEARAGIEAVAAAITSRTGRPAAAIAVAGVDLGDEFAYDSPLARHLRRAAQAVGRGLPD